MFVVSSSYVKPLTEVDEHITAHQAFLDKYYQAGKFICSGRKSPRTGGLILANAKDRDEIQQIMAEDPFSVHQIAVYEIIEFSPTKFAPDFKSFLE